MILNIISTVNGKENEGMRNVASHIIENLGKMCTVRMSALGNPMQCVKNSIGADGVLIFARASAKTACLGKILRRFCKKVCFFLVQKPEPSFMKKIGDPGKFRYFAILPKDGEILAKRGGRICAVPVGIDREKFRPAVNENEIIDIRRKYGFTEELPLVLHVGHLSKGRGLEEFLHLPKDKFQRVVVASGLFTDPEVERILTNDGVSIIKEYLPDVSEVYRMADVYLFPTRSAEFVISIPLSVMEALSCGVPVIAFKGVPGLSVLSEYHSDEIFAVDDPAELSELAESVARRYFGGCRSLLRNVPEWSKAAEVLLESIADGGSAKE